MTAPERIPLPQPRSITSPSVMPALRSASTSTGPAARANPPNPASWMYARSSAYAVVILRPSLEPMFNGLFGEFIPEELISQRLHERGLLVVRGAAVPSFDVLVVEHVVPLVLHLGNHLSRMPGMNPVVAG